MKKKISVHRLIGRRTYTTVELARKLGVHPQTVRTWRQDGLKPINASSHHALYLGSAVKRYYTERQLSSKVTLGPNQYYCLSCKSAVEATDVVTVDQQAKLGHNKRSMRREGKCIRCGNKVCRFFTQSPNILAEEGHINIDRPSSLYHSQSSGKDNHV
jgi:transposase-like protein